MDRIPAATITVGLISALLLASVLVPALKADGPDKPDILVQVMGGTTELASDMAYEAADLYYHGGVGHEHCEHSEKCEYGRHDEVREQHVADLPLVGLVRRLHGETAPKEHKHLHGAEEKEVLPWFVVAVRLDPHNIDAWRDGSFWFYRTGESQQAEEFICEAIRRNPKDYRLYLDRGVLYHRLKKWDKSINDLEVAERLWKNISDDSDTELRAIGVYLEDARKKAALPLGDR